MGYPILGDPQYATDASREVSRQLGVQTQRLCARKLEFLHPVTGQAMQIVSRLDAELEK